VTECFLLLYILTSGFTLKWSISQGVLEGRGRICIQDSDRDGNYDFVFAHDGYPESSIYYYELQLPNSWQKDSVAYPYCPLLWDSGDFDADGFYDLVMQCGSPSPYWVGMTVFESPDSFSYPIQEVWRDTVGFALVTPICAYDIDQDGFAEIVKVIGDTTDLDIHESTNDNHYERIYRFTAGASHSPMSTLAFGDFDLDNQNEFVLGYSGGEYCILECTGNNSYQEITFQQLPTANIKDCFSVPDADGDSKLEFVVKGFTVFNARIHAFIFEATGDNTYEIIKSFDLAGGYNLYGGGYSEAGDVDGDSIPEIVLEACQSIYIIKSAGNDSFYVWETLPGNLTGSSVRVTNDLDGNGLNEIVVSGNNQTRIYEYDPGGVTEEASQVQAGKLKVFPNPFREKITIRWQKTDSRQQKTDNKLQINIYNSAGQLVRFLTLPGNNSLLSTIVWSGDDNAGRKLPPGVYFIHLQAGEYGIISKVTLVR